MRFNFINSNYYGYKIRIIYLPQAYDTKKQFLLKIKKERFKYLILKFQLNLQQFCFL